MLPPPRSGFDHCITLKDGTDVFSLRPYKYNILQKDIIHNIMEEML